MKFKVGDRVKYIRGTTPATVIEVDASIGRVDILYDDESRFETGDWYDEEELEFYKGE